MSGTSNQGDFCCTKSSGVAVRGDDNPRSCRVSCGRGVFLLCGKGMPNACVRIPHTAWVTCTISGSCESGYGEGLDGFWDSDAGDFASLCVRGFARVFRSSLRELIINKLNSTVGS